MKSSILPFILVLIACTPTEKQPYAGMQLDSTQKSEFIVFPAEDEKIMLEEPVQFNASDSLLMDINIPQELFITQELIPIPVEPSPAQ